MATRQKPSKIQARRFLRQLYLGCFVSAISIWIFIYFYTVPTYFKEWHISSVKVFLYSPRYLSVNDENVVRFALENTQDQVVNATVQLVNGGTVPSFLGSENNLLYSGPIRGHEQINRQLLVFLPLSSNMLGKMAGLGLRGTVGDVSWAEDLPIRIAPVPRIQSIGNYLEGIFLAVVGSALGLINDILRQFLQSDRVKK
jgi:hypothetical protein